MFRAHKDVIALKPALGQVASRCYRAPRELRATCSAARGRIQDGYKTLRTKGAQGAKKTRRRSFADFFVFCFFLLTVAVLNDPVVAQRRLPSPDHRDLNIASHHTEIEGSEELYQRAKATRLPATDLRFRPAQFVQQGGAAENSQPMELTGRRLEIRPRYGTGYQFYSVPDPQNNERITVIDGGAMFIVYGSDALGTVEILTDRLVMWTEGQSPPDLSGQTLRSEDAPVEVYLEGNIVFRQGDRIIYAKTMYYHVTAENGIVLDAEAFTPIPEYEGLLRVKADVLQQLNRNQFQAFGASITSSRLGVPQYWIQSENIFLQDTPRPRINPFTGQREIDSDGTAILDHQWRVTSRNNFLYLGGIPVFYWPTIATDFEQPFYYIDRFTIKNDRVFGTQVLTDFDVYQLLGVRNPPAGTDWNVTLDYLGERGFGYGTLFEYDRTDMFGSTAPFRGFLDAWGIDDQGLDNLGRGRRALVPEEDFRGRVRGRHRQVLPSGWQLTAEVGLISDRNFLEQYFEREWDEEKDQTTGIELKRTRDNRSLALSGDIRTNEFFTQTEGGRLDHFVLGQPLLFDRLTWFEHSHGGYAHLETADMSTNPADPSAPLPWETLGGFQYDDRGGLRAATRQEIDLPFHAGPVKIVPYALGEFAHWDEDRMGNEVSRWYGQTGVRASLPMWKVDPTIKSELFNVNGVAHKVVYESEFFWADANRNLARFPLYDPLQDDAIEHFERRFILFDYGGALPPMFDDRFFAFRYGLQSWVTSPSTEIADDLLIWRNGIRQRWQTKRGFRGREQIIDWITLDMNGTLFPKPGRDNFGEDVGLVDYDFRWHVGDRLTLLSDGYFDTFSNGLRMVTMGAFLSRPPRGKIFVGFRSLEGPITSSVVATSLSYQMSPKWITRFGSSVDLSATGNIGQNLSFTRIGESFLVTTGFHVDVSRSNVGARLMIEPRFLPSSKTGRVGGVRIPPVGAFGLE